MPITIDTSWLFEFISLPIQDQILKMALFMSPIFIIVFIWGAIQLWLDFIQDQWGSLQKSVLLAIDIPRNNQQSPKAIENMFTYFLGAHSDPNLIEKYWLGVYQLSFSFEIVSIEGYTQYLINTPEKFRDLVEAAVYSQYPDAEITEVDDYTKFAPKSFPDEEYDVWGSDFIQNPNQMLPIKTYSKFEHQLGDLSLTFRDPISSLMSLCSSLGKGEQLWFQIICKPIGFDWIKAGEDAIKKILKEKVDAPKDIFDIIFGLLESALSSIFDILGGGTGEAAKEPDPMRMFNLKPKEKKQVESIQEKISKGAFAAKVRMVYIARKEVMNKPKAVNGFVGFIKQFSDLDLNGLKPDSKTTATTASYFFVESRLNERKRKIVKNYRNRSGWAGKLPGILNVEELASLWHFPIEEVTKAPLLQKAPGRRAEPPGSLPTEDQKPAEQLIDPIFHEALAEKRRSFTQAGRQPGVGESISFPTEEDVFVDPERRQPDRHSRTEPGKISGPPPNLPFMD